MSTPDQSSTGSSVLDSYPVRIMLGLAVSLVLMLILTNAPLYPSTDQVGWSPYSSNLPPERIDLSEVRSASPSKDILPETAGRVPPSTDLRLPQSRQESTSKSSSEPQSTSSQSGDSVSVSQSDARRVSTLDPDDQRPKIVGGLGKLYLNIEYPKKARDQGIAGRLRLEFTVQTDGSVRNVEVIDSLHPLCDSAAVEGVRSVQFVPAERSGTLVPARMTLPVRFRLITTPKAVDASP